MLNDPDLVRAMANQFASTGTQFIDNTAPFRYSYNFTWLGLPVIQFPQDLVAMQELIWAIRPDVIVETGVAHGGSLIFYASVLELLGGPSTIIGIDIDIRPHNRNRIETHPMAGRIRLIEGSSTDETVVRRVHSLVGDGTAIVILDSNHTHDHVLTELRCYSPLVGADSYIVVMDTVVEDMRANAFPDRPWSTGNNPKTAVHAFLAENDRFEIDRSIPDKLLITAAPDGYLHCILDP